MQYSPSRLRGIYAVPIAMWPTVWPDGLGTRYAVGRRLWFIPVN
jgi:hypothetical protein